MTIKNIEDTDQLGRCCFDTKYANRKPNTGYIRRAFGDRQMSVDYNPEDNISFLTSLHVAEAARRTSGQSFHGWYVFEARIVTESGGEVVPDATHDNPWHCNVISPDLEEGDELLQFYGKISANADWLSRSGPSLNPVVERELEDILDSGSV